MIIFLDFDGVLHPIPSSRTGFFCHMERFEAILRHYDALQVVISSNWRERLDIKELRELFASDLQNRIVSVTPVLHGASRYEEILSWLDDNYYHGAWLAIDDFPEGFPANVPKLCICERTIGFDEETEKKLIAMLGKAYWPFLTSPRTWPNEEDFKASNLFKELAQIAKEAGIENSERWAEKWALKHHLRMHGRRPIDILPKDKFERADWLYEAISDAEKVQK